MFILISPGLNGGDGGDGKGSGGKGSGKGSGGGGSGDRDIFFGKGKKQDGTLSKAKAWSRVRGAKWAWNGGALSSCNMDVIMLLPVPPLL